MNAEKVFTNDNFRILSILYSRKDETNLVKITQLELAEELHMSRATINMIFKTLKENGYLTHNTKRVGHYYLTAEALKVIETFRSLKY